jgi:hypothetical protein
MPLLEVTQSRQISASIRLDETTAAQVDQYAAFIHASADDVVDISRTSSKLRKPPKFPALSVSVKHRPTVLSRAPRRSPMGRQMQGWSPREVCGH